MRGAGAEETGRQVRKTGVRETGGRHPSTVCGDTEVAAPEEYSGALVFTERGQLPLIHEAVITATSRPEKTGREKAWTHFTDEQTTQINDRKTPTRSKPNSSNTESDHRNVWPSWFARGSSPGSTLKIHKCESLRQEIAQQPPCDHPDRRGRGFSRNPAPLTPRRASSRDTEPRELP